jgi:16S rRNA A1518/A1519 N6-dimethyltransferase RsmA/KsgA/DIM1 with predicted DNA glycosylase/AP lyase activity
MVQKEVADKIRTDAEKKSFLWWLLNYQYIVKHIKTVPAKAFSPAPKVQSAIFSLIAKPETPDFAYDDMVAILEKVSMYKRKTLGKSRKMADLEKKYPLPEDLAGKRLEEIGLEEMGRILGV